MVLACSPGNTCHWCDFMYWCNYLVIDSLHRKTVFHEVRDIVHSYIPNTQHSACTQQTLNKCLLDTWRVGILLTIRGRRWYHSLFTDKAQGGLVTHPKVTQPESDGVCPGMSPCQQDPEGEQMGLFREELGSFG